MADQKHQKTISNFFGKSTPRKSLQRADITYGEAKQFIDVAVLSLKSLGHTPGPYTKSVLAELPDEPDDSGRSLYKGHDIKDTDNERTKCQAAAEAFIEEVVMRLHTTFPDSSVMSSFNVLSPRDAPHDDKDLVKLLKHFSPLVDSDAALTEWQLLTQVMNQDRFQSLNLQTFYKKYLHLNRETFPNLSQMAAIGLIIPVTSVECERGISRYNSIKTDARSCLTVANTENILKVSLEAKPIQEFDFDLAFKYWIAMKDRRGYHAMMREVQQDTPCSTTNSSATLDFTKDLPLDLSTY